MSSDLVRKLTDRHGYPVVDESSLDAFLAANPQSLLFFTEDPARYPESDDVAVILPELMKLYGECCAAAVVARAAEKALQTRYGFSAWPALVVLRGEQYLGTLTRVQDWNDFVLGLGRLLSAEPSRPPGIGIRLVEEPVQHCH